jgi:hypothetical protein
MELVENQFVKTPHTNSGIRKLYLRELGELGVSFRD